MISVDHTLPIIPLELSTEQKYYQYYRATFQVAEYGYNIGDSKMKSSILYR